MKKCKHCKKELTITKMKGEESQPYFTQGYHCETCSRLILPRTNAKGKLLFKIMNTQQRPIINKLLLDDDYSHYHHLQKKYLNATMSEMEYDLENLQMRISNDWRKTQWR